MMIIRLLIVGVIMTMVAWICSAIADDVSLGSFIHYYLFGWGMFLILFGIYRPRRQ
jgi:cytochrome c biogenesis factor